MKKKSDLSNELKFEGDIFINLKDANSNMEELKAEEESPTKIIKKQIEIDH